ncbi:serine/threonine-protein kinase [Paraliomyxa miuraensis]|uniref:serine/threonine-protein kinase n=1 Tax=Paraliomyxa miuraensis TaxID=376150 RepID=UPI00224E49F8|nr:serine/threonine-protein kinase [Paraliomyxa miuraensis]MCX4245963.1 protein kinase [Paraliomyxa miuraensis]
MQSRLLPGQRIGTATIERALGEGGFACVYRARTDAGLVCAIKVAHEATEAMSTAELGLLQNEIEAVLRLRHRSLVKTHGYGYLDDGRLYLVMELVEGEPLIDHIERQGRLDPAEALAMLEQVAEVMAYCHEQGVLHLDLKPDNILVTDRHGPAIRVLDFGVARLARASRGEQRVIAGTPAYMAPECFGDTARHPSMDVYALGVTLHVMLTGELAFGEGGVTTQIELKQSGPPQLCPATWESAPPGLAELLRATLAVVPEERPTMGAIRRQARRLYFLALAGGLSLAGGSGPASGGLSSISGMSAADGGLSQPIRVLELHGRDAELEALRGRWAAAQQLATGATVVLGAQGTGKSALIERFLEDHGAEPALVAYGRCRESGDLVPFGVIREAAGQLGEKLRALPNWRRLARSLRHTLGSLEGVLISLVPEAQPPGAPVVSPPLKPGAEAVGQAVATLLDVVARDRPVVLVVEDLQWAGAGVHAVLEHVARAALPGVFLLLSARERPGWAHDQHVIELANLRAADNDALLRALLGTDDLVVLQRLQQHVPVLAAGIPLATVQVAADLQMQGCVRVGPRGGVELDEERLRAYVPPANVAEVLERRLERLSEPSRRVLAAGALQGRRFEVDDLLEIGPFEPREVQVALLDAHALGLVHVDGRHCWIAHDTLVERLAGSWAPEEARQIHARIADRMGRTAGPPGPAAHHLELAGKTTEAVRIHLAAARHADVLHDLAAAARHFRRVIELCEALPPGPRRVKIVREAIFEYSRLAGAQGAVDEAFTVIDQGVAVLARQGRGEDEDIAIDSARARLHYLRGELGPALELSRRCVERAGDDPSARRFVVLPANLVGRALYLGGRFGEAAPALARGCELAAAEVEHVELSHSLGMLGLSLAHTGVLSEARVYLGRSARLADELGDPVRRLAVLCYEAIAAEITYDWTTGVIRSADALAFATQQGIDGLYHTVSMMFAGRHQFHVGQLSRARLLLEHSIERSRRQGQRPWRGWAHVFLGDVAFVQNRYDEATACYDEGLRVGHDDEYTRALGLLGRAHVRAITGGDAKRVHDDATDALRRLDAVDNRSSRPHALLRYADAVESLEALDGQPPDQRPDHGQSLRGRAQSLRGQAQSAFERLGLETVDWWPQPPATAEVVGSARAYWRCRDRPTIPPPGRPAISEALLRRLSRTLSEEAHTLRGLPNRLARRPPGA